MGDYNFSSVPVYPHHLKQNVSGSRAKYREGRKDRAVKVYTINQESVYLLITGVPAIGTVEELRGICDQYGIIEDFRPVDDYPSEQFTEAHLVKYKYFPAARAAKKCLDDRSFFGGNLHVFYAPEFESIEETRQKLQERRKYVAWKTKQGFSFEGHAPTFPHSQASSGSSSFSYTTTTKSSSHTNTELPKPVTYIWAGKEYTSYPETPSLEQQKPCETKASSAETFLPRQLQRMKTTDCTEQFISHGIKRLYAGADKPKESSLLDSSSYANTISDIQTKLLHVSVPNTRISLKRKRRL